MVNVNLVLLADLAILHIFKLPTFNNKVYKSNNRKQLKALIKFLLNIPAEASKQIRLNPHPKLYSDELILDFMKKRQESKTRAEQQTINEHLKYPEKLIKYLDELPPSLRPLDARMLENHEGKLKLFGVT